MTLASWLWLAVLVACCLVAPIAWLHRTYYRWRRDLRDVRLFREAVQTPAGRHLFRQIVACRDAQVLAAYDAEMDHYLHGGSSS